MSPTLTVRLKRAIFAAGLLPLVALGLRAYRNGLGANPIAVITHSTGTWTLVFLLITLGVTPLRKLTGFHWLLRFRRMLGLYAFFYACLHFLTYVWLDQFFDWHAMLKDIAKRPFITVGFAAFVMLVPLAVTSTNAMVRRLGAKRWQALHRLVYIIAIGGVLHYLWLVKKDITQPVIYGVILACLLGFRVIAALTRPGSSPKPLRPATAVRSAKFSVDGSG
ncbi:MAG: protein-methionine-sulfoxide reductase heme-binding subunit MsrQ [Acidiferrobacterales bacterium]